MLRPHRLQARAALFGFSLNTRSQGRSASGSQRNVEMRLPLAAIVVALSIAPLHAQTSGPSGIQGVESDKFSPLMTINGIHESENRLGGMSKTWNLRSFVGKFDGATTHQLYVGVNYFSSTRRKVFNSASDDTAMPLTVKAIASEADYSCSRKLFAYGCDYTEDIGIRSARPLCAPMPLQDIASRSRPKAAIHLF
jgi:hypothetical protein